MPKLLQINSSPMGSEAVSRRLTCEFRERWLKAGPQREVTVRDLTMTRIPVVDAAWVTAACTPEGLRTEKQKESLWQSFEFTDELLCADEFVLGAPMHNWGPPACLKLWMDRIVTPAAKSARILRQKHGTFMIAAGGSYSPGSRSASRDHLVPWLRTVFEGLGLESMRFLIVDGTHDANCGKCDRERFLAPYLASAQAMAG